ncbi:MAG: hypothetical protein HKN36_01945 [Hellea sp.]|nr:hypothetical protein [Hellea sp.]
MDIVAYIESMADSAPWLIYAAILVGPFIQEDAAVFVTATVSALGKVNPALAFAAVLMGLFLSDIWKYWIGWAILKNRKVAKIAERDKIVSLGEKVQSYPFTTLVSARFIPLTRIPTLAACGFFQMSYLKFCFFVAITAALFVSLFFGSMHVMGALMAEKLKWVLPVIGVGFILVIYSWQLTKKRINN